MPSLIRTGRWAKREAEGPWAYGRGGAGLHASVLPWLRERDVAVLAGDAVNDVQPSGVEGMGRPVHTLTQVNLGLPIADNAYLEDVAREAERLGRWEFHVQPAHHVDRGRHGDPLQRERHVLTTAARGEGLVPPPSRAPVRRLAACQPLLPRSPGRGVTGSPSPETAACRTPGRGGEPFLSRPARRSASAPRALTNRRRSPCAADPRPPSWSRSPGP